MGFVSDLFGAGDAKKAAKASAQGFQKGEETYRQAYNLFNPYASLGQSGVNTLAALQSGDTSAFRADPGYQFAVDEGTKGVQNYLAKTGMTFSGPGIKAIERYRQGLADQQYQNYLANQMGIAGLGMNAANSQLGAAHGIANMQTGGADARASGYLAKAGIKSGISNALLGAGIGALSGGFGGSDPYGYKKGGYFGSSIDPFG